MSKKKKSNKKKKTSSLALQRAHMLLFSLKRRWADAVDLDPEYYDFQPELLSFGVQIANALEECKKGIVPDMDFLQEAMIKTVDPATNKYAARDLKILQLQIAEKI